MDSPVPSLISGDGADSGRKSATSDCPLLELKAVKLSTKANEKILDGVSFSLEAGAVTALIGPSGCGKTTTALAIMRLAPAGAICTGEIYLQGRNLIALSEKHMRRIRGADVAMIFQEPGLALNPVMRVGTQVMEVMRAHLPWDRARREHEARRLFEELEFDSVDRVFDSYPHQLSGGQCQRVVIAQALGASPSLIIADEPTASLDVAIQAEIMALLKRMQQRKKVAILFITHDPALVSDFARQVLIMEAGRIVETGPIDSVFRNPKQAFTRTVLQIAQQRLAWATA